MLSSGTLRCVTHVRTDVSAKRGTSSITVTKIGELGTTLGASSNRRMLRRTLFLLTAARPNITEDGILHSYRRGNLKSHMNKYG
jgi:hypothetical protein